jgi:hypothetical protein
MTSSESTTKKALTSIIDALTPLSPEERHRTVGAAMMFLGETVAPKRKTAEPDAAVDDDGDADGHYSSYITKWMRQHGILAEELDQVFHFKPDSSFDLLNAPGKSKKEQTLNTYTLTGLGHYLATGSDRNFDDATARAFCERIGCYDQANHAAHLKNRGPEFTGEKRRGYELTNPGIKRGTALVKEVSGRAGG